jgi:hypothetical protein
MRSLHRYRHRNRSLKKRGGSWKVWNLFKKQKKDISPWDFKPGAKALPPIKEKQTQKTRKRFFLKRLLFPTPKNRKQNP